MLGGRRLVDNGIMVETSRSVLKIGFSRPSGVGIRIISF